MQTHHEFKIKGTELTRRDLAILANLWELLSRLVAMGLSTWVGAPRSLVMALTMQCLPRPDFPKAMPAKEMHTIR